MEAIFAFRLRQGSGEHRSGQQLFMVNKKETM
jgi:hypothetical protein